jgi:hypothetical protein
VLGALNGLGILDDTQKAEILNGGKIGVVTVAATASATEAEDGGKNIALLAREQLEVLAKIAAGDSANVTFVEDSDRKYAGNLTKIFTVVIGIEGGVSRRQINVAVSAFVK